MNALLFYCLITEQILMMIEVKQLFWGFALEMMSSLGHKEV